MILIPYATDAPIYHRPIATIGLIAANVFVYMTCVAMGGSVSVPPLESHWLDSLILEFGVINPVQWVTSFFMHAGPLHLIGNMIFLWAFGMVVEGKLGWRRFLMVYFTIGIVQNAIEQILFFFIFDEGGSLGASSAIFGLLAIAVIWAPKNEFSVVYFYYRFGGTFDVAIAWFALLYLGIEMLTILHSLGGSLMTTILHLMGAAVGAAIGLGMLLTRSVDCENWDLLSVLQGRAGAIPMMSDQERASLRAQRVAREQERAFMVDDAEERIAEGLSKGQFEIAYRRYQAARKADPDFEASQKVLYQLIRTLDEQERWSDAVPLVERYLTRFHEHDTILRLKLAREYILQQSRPRQGLRCLTPIDPASTTQQQQEFIRRLRTRAQQMIRQGTLEVRD